MKGVWVVLVWMAVVCVRESSAMKAYPVPLFAWAQNDKYLTSGRTWVSESHTTEEVEEMLGGMGRGKEGKSALPLSPSLSSPPEIVVLFLEPNLLFGKSDLIGGVRSTSESSHLKKFKRMLEGAAASLVVPYTYDMTMDSTHTEEERDVIISFNWHSTLSSFSSSCSSSPCIYVEAMDEESRSAWGPFFEVFPSLVDLSSSSLKEHVKEMGSNGQTDLVIIHLPSSSPLSSYDEKVEEVMEEVKGSTGEYVALFTADDPYLPTKSTLTLRETPVKYEWEKVRRGMEADNTTTTPSPSPSPSSPSDGEFTYSSRWPEYVWECLLSFLLLVIIFGFGVCCLCGMDTPPRFDNPKVKNL